jgi:pimeloyl-ACP methyl ester carboxylesterase
MEPESLRVPASDGLSLRLLRWSHEGTPLLLVHGFSNEAHIWDDFAPELAPYYQVMAVDLRGHGDSDWDPQSRYDYEHHLADLVAVVEHLGFERMVLIGHSLGGRVCTRYAGQHPDKVAGLVVVDTGPEHDPRGITRIQLDVREHTNPSFGSHTEYEIYLSHAYPAATPASIKHMARHGLKEREDGRLVLKMDTAFRTRAAGEVTAEEMKAHEETNTKLLWEALGTIPCPVLIVRGAASDILSADCADRMVDEVLQNGTLAVVPQAGHSVMTDNPQHFRDAVCGFVLGE